MMSLKIDGCIVAGSVVTIQLNRAADSRGERAYQARLFVAVPEMYELIHDLSQAYDDNQSSHELASRLYDLRRVALRLLDKIEGGGDNG